MVLYLSGLVLKMFTIEKTVVQMILNVHRKAVLVMSRVEIQALVERLTKQSCDLKARLFPES